MVLPHCFHTAWSPDDTLAYVFGCSSFQAGSFVRMCQEQPLCHLPLPDNLQAPRSLCCCRVVGQWSRGMRSWGCSEDSQHGPQLHLLVLTLDAPSPVPLAKPTQVCQREVAAQQEGQGAEAKGEEAQVPPVHPPGPKAGQGSACPGLLLRQDPAAAAAFPAAADPQSAAAAAAALQLPGHPACPAQVGAATAHTLGGLGPAEGL